MGRTNINHGNRWKGGKVTCGNRVRHKIISHPRANRNGYVSESILIAEKIFGKPLPQKAIVHHIDKNPMNNNPSNLLICENREYHALIHLRMRAKQECGNPNKRKCMYCKQWDFRENMGHHSKYTYCHWRCNNESRKKNRRNSD